MALGLPKKGMHWGHWVAGFLTVAAAAFVGITYGPKIAGWISGLFTKSSGGTGT